MDIISFNEAATANGRIEKFIKDPDSNSGVVTVPKVIAAGESVTVPAGRVAVLPNVQVDGEIVVEAGGEIFIPAGATLSKVVELEGDQTISDVKTFLESPIVPTPTTGTQAVNKDYVDNGPGANFVTNDQRVKTALNASGEAPIYACRAWANFNGTGTVAIRASGNVSSITDNGVGQYTVNFTTAMNDANYAANVTVGPPAGGADHSLLEGTTYTAYGFKIYIMSAAIGGNDRTYVCCSVFR